MAKAQASNQQCIIYDKCDIHLWPESVSDSHIVTLRDHQSWLSLLEAAQVREHTYILDLAAQLPPDGNAIPHISYHRTCRARYTMKKDLEAIKKRKLAAELEIRKTDNEEGCSYNTRKRRNPSTARVYKKECIFCKREKYVKYFRTREKLIQAAQLRVDERLRNIATILNDQKILAVTSRDIVAAEAHYHATCYKDYTRERAGATNASMANDEDEDEYNDIPDGIDTYQSLFNYIYQKIVTDREILANTSIINKLEEIVTSKGVQNIDLASKKNLRVRIQRYFQDSILTVTSDSGKLFWYSDSLTKEELVKKILVLEKRVEELTTTTSVTADLNKSATIIRKEIRNLRNMQEWPPQPSKLCQESANIPHYLKYFLQVALTGQTVEGNVKSRVSRQVASIGQDIIYAATNGRRKPPKHILLPLVIKSLTGNVELIKILNRLGHGISYSTMEEIETALAIQKISQTNSLPTDLQTGSFTTLVWDNIDRLEETLSGAGTSHRVNGIAIQPYAADGFSAERLQPIQRTKQRAITDVLPDTIVPYNAGEKPEPPKTITVDLSNIPGYTDICKMAKIKNQAFVLYRIMKLNVPSWTGFNILIRDTIKVIPDTISYLPSINAPATDMSTVNEILKQSVNIMEELGISNSVIVFDQALYAKATQVLWKHPLFYKKIILRMGDFHTMLNLLSIIGKCFQDAGLCELAVEAGIISEGSIQSVMDGHQYNCAVQLHKLVYEALLKLTWKQFIPWLRANHATYIAEYNLLEHILHSDEEINSNSINKNLESDCLKNIFGLFGNFMNNLRSGLCGNLAQFWISYIDLVEILLNLIRAAREGNWFLHLNSIQAMIPWTFAYDKTNYSRYLPIYFAQMTQLQNTHPEVYEHFLNGYFSVQRRSTNPFGKIPADQAIEETVNKDTQTPGGTKGFSLNIAALSRYYLTAEYRSSALRAIRDMVHSTTTSSHDDLHMPRIKKDNADVSNLVNILDSEWINPMDPINAELVSLSSGQMATTEIEADLRNAHKIGYEQYVLFKSERLEGDTSFYKANKKNNLKTFSNLAKTKKVKASDGKQVVLQADRDLFAHMILTAQSRNLDLKEVLNYPLGPMPWSLSLADGSLRKTNKAALCKAMIQSTSLAEDIIKPVARIIDGMSLVQQIHGDKSTFGEIAQFAFSLALKESAECGRVDVVFDVYRDISIKNIERGNRGEGQGIQFQQIKSGHSVKQWRKFLCNSSNKTLLIRFIVEQWKKEEYRQKLGDKELYVTAGDCCVHLTKDSYAELEDLHCTHEEADTRVFIHAKHAADNGYASVILTAQDTDILVIAVHFEKQINAHLYQKLGTKNRIQYVDVRKIVLNLGNNVAESLIGLHTFTGCDSVSAFAGKGKIAAFKLLQKQLKYQECFKKLGNQWTLPYSLIHQLELFLCELYGTKKATCINEARYQLFCAKRGKLNSSQLPPCFDALMQHCRRANYQAGIWKRALECEPEIPSPNGNGWQLTVDNLLEIKWMTSLPAPLSVLDFMACDCSRVCDRSKCKCIANGLKCTKMCSLQNCTNQKSEHEDLEQSSDDDDEELDSDDDEV